jgi:hypothetical protein
MPYQYIQQTSVSNAAAANSCTAGIQPEPTFTAGNMLVYVAKYTFPSQLPTMVTDSLGNIFTPVINFYDSSGNSGIQAGYAQNITGGPDNITAQFGASSPTFNALYVAEFSGLDTLKPYTFGEMSLQKNASPGTTPNAITSGVTPTLSRTPALLFGFGIDSTGTTGAVISGGSGFNQLPGVWLFGSGTTISSLPEHMRLTTYTPVAAVFTTTVGSDTFYALGMTFAEANAQEQLASIVSSGVFVCP